ncbi:helix-turn-helix domain-containing protein [Chthonobacter albigriseus]|uniref:helix-turn-helix domain-containing protein n=1 Tax=Chthonobacter albigriseus TaxID=1683161 RepID=UPI0015EE877F|nr:helix-turn-helix domain-containing protein [Chthonobacter albigriseus]
MMTTADCVHTVQRLLDNGFLPIPLRYGTKAFFPGFINRRATYEAFEEAIRFDRGLTPNFGLRLDNLAALDIDDDIVRANKIRAAVRAVAGDGLFRYGDGTKGGVLLYRATAGLKPWTVGQVEFRTGRTMVVAAFGLHPKGQPYRWHTESPLDVDSADLPLINAELAVQIRAIVATFYPAEAVTRPTSRSRQTPRSGPLADGRRTALRDEIAAEIGRRLRDGAPVDFASINAAAQLWFFGSGAINLTRPKGSTGRPWREADVAAEVRYALRPARLKLFGPMQTARTWTLPMKRGLLDAIRADRRATDRHVQVAAALLDAHRGDNEEAVQRRARRGGIASETLAAALGTSDRYARRLRADLVAWGYFSEKAKGYRPGVTADGRRYKGKAPTVIPNDAWLPLLRFDETGSQDVVVPFTKGPDADNSKHAQSIDMFKRTGKPGTVQFHNTTTKEGPAIRPSQDVPSLTIVAGADIARQRGDDIALMRWPHLFARDFFGQVRPIPTADKVALGIALKELREAAGLSQTETARRAGLLQGSLSNSERGHDGLSTTAIARLLEILSAA